MSFFLEKKLNSLPAKGLFNSILTAYKSRHWAIHNITKVVLSKTPTQVYDTWFQILQTLIYRIDYIILLIKVIKPHDTVWYPENNVENQKALPDWHILLLFQVQNADDTVKQLLFLYLMEQESA